MIRIKNAKVEVIQGDITELKVDAIVNAANNKLIMGGGVAGAIKKGGGKVIEEEAMRLGPIEIGEAIATSAGALVAKFVIHAVTMGLDFKTDEKKICAACRNALKVAEELKINSIAFPALGCGVGGFSYEAAAKIMAQEVFCHLRERPSELEKVVFCLYDKEAYDVFNQAVSSSWEDIERKLQNSPLVTVDVIIELNDGVALIKRKNPPLGWALPGGFVDYGESLEESSRREAKEETGLEIENLIQFHTYSEPSRDPRFHTISTVYIAQAKGRPHAATDAAEVKVFKFEELKDLEFAFDHKKIIGDYIKFRRKKKRNH